MFSKEARRRVAVYVHRAAAPLLGLQILIWLVSGLGFALIPLEDDKAVPEADSVSVGGIAPESFHFDLKRLRKFTGDKSIQEIRFQIRQGAPIIRIDLAGRAEPLLLDASGKNIVPRLSEQEAVALAGKYLKKPLTVKSAELLWHKKDGFDYDYWGEYPVWRVDFDNWKKTRLYLSAYTGELVGRKNVAKTLFDWCWSLHTFGYVDKDYYHNIPLVLSAGLGVIFSLAGFYLFWVWWDGRRV